MARPKGHSSIDGQSSWRPIECILRVQNGFLINIVCHAVAFHVTRRTEHFEVGDRNFNSRQPGRPGRAQCRRCIRCPAPLQPGTNVTTFEID
jgi:hypothetical protein